MRQFLGLCLLFITVTLTAANQQPIDVDQAFQFTATARDSQTILGMWQIAKGYYLYKNRISFVPINPQIVRLGQPIFPSTNTTKQYPGIGSMLVYKDSVNIAVPILASKKEMIFINVYYQGCSEAGYCYPPQKKTVNIDLSGNYMVPVTPLKIDIAPNQRPVTRSSEQTNVFVSLKEKNLFVIIVYFLSFGLLLSLTPCVLPMIPILSGIIIGQRHISHSRAFGLSLFYVLGMAITYAIAGILFGYIGDSIQVIMQQPWIIGLFSFIFILMALSMFGLFTIQLPEKIRGRIHNISEHQKRGTYFGVFFMGVLSTLILSPCVTPPLVAALSFISQTGNILTGGTALFAMGIGMGVPLLIIGASSAKLLPKVGPWMNSIKNILGVIMLGVALWMLARIEWIPGQFIVILWATLAIGVAIAMGALSSVKTGWQFTKKVVGLVFFIYGIVLIISALNHNTNPFTPFQNLTSQQNTSENTLKFIPVKSLADLKKQLNIARNKNKPVILDFYADWCISCKEMDAFTFSNQRVIEILKNYILLRADVTKSTYEIKQLERHFQVVAPPTILFFNAQGKEIPELRIVGEISANSLIQHLQQ